MKIIRVSVAAVLFAVSTVGCVHVKAVQAIQPAITTDTAKVWVHIVTNDENVNGIYRCSDEGPKPVCTKADLVH